MFIFHLPEISYSDKPFYIQLVGLINQAPTTKKVGLMNQTPTILKQTSFKSVGLMNQTPHKMNQAPTQDESSPYDFQPGIDHLRSLTFLKSKDRI